MKRRKLSYVDSDFREPQYVMNGTRIVRLTKVKIDGRKYKVYTRATKNTSQYSDSVTDHFFIKYGPDEKKVDLKDLVQTHEVKIVEMVPVWEVAKLLLHK